MGNILVVISELVAASVSQYGFHFVLFFTAWDSLCYIILAINILQGSEWDSFIHLLVACLKSAIANMLSHSLASSTSAAGGSSSYSSSFSLLKSRPENSNWSKAAAIIRVLRKTLKYLKQEDDDHLCEMYLDSVSSFLSDVPWDLMHEIQNGQSNDAKESDSQNSHFIHVRNDGEETRVVFLGNFIQFLCSLIEQSCAMESKGDSHHEHHPVHCMSISFVPKLLVWCLEEHGNVLKTSVSHYFRHKLLVRICFSCFLCTIEKMDNSHEIHSQDNHIVAY